MKITIEIEGSLARHFFESMTKPLHVSELPDQCDQMLARLDGPPLVRCLLNDGHDGPCGFPTAQDAPEGKR